MVMELANCDLSVHVIGPYAREHRGQLRKNNNTQQGTSEFGHQEGHARACRGTQGQGLLLSFAVGLMRR